MTREEIEERKAALLKLQAVHEAAAEQSRAKALMYKGAAEDCDHWLSKLPLEEAPPAEKKAASK